MGERPPLSVTYSYLPGAADDEESWARGLTPALMWRHAYDLLAAGPRGIAGVVQRIVDASLQAPETLTSNDEEAEAVPTSGSWMAGPRSAVPGGGGQHCQLPQGCQRAEEAAVQRVGGGIYLLGVTGMALGAAAAAHAPGVFSHVDAVLHLGLHPLPGMEQEQQAAAAAAASEATAGAGAGPPLATGAAAVAASCRYCWVPVAGGKRDRRALQHQLPHALRFARSQLRRGRRLLLCCDSGLDASVSTAVACLLAFYRLEGRQEGGRRVPVWAAEGGGEDGEDEQQQRQPATGLAAGGTGLFSKLTVRQHLAVLTAHYPAARPTRDSLRQVFNFFFLEKPAGGSL